MTCTYSCASTIATMLKMPLHLSINFLLNGSTFLLTRIAIRLLFEQMYDNNLNETENSSLTQGRSKIKQDYQRVILPPKIMTDHNV